MHHIDASGLGIESIQHYSSSSSHPPSQHRSGPHPKEIILSRSFNDYGPTTTAISFQFAPFALHGTKRWPRPTVNTTHIHTRKQTHTHMHSQHIVYACICDACMLLCGAGVRAFFLSLLLQHHRRARASCFIAGPAPVVRARAEVCETCVCVCVPIKV